MKNYVSFFFYLISLTKKLIDNYCFVDSKLFKKLFKKLKIILKINYFFYFKLYGFITM